MKKALLGTSALVAAGLLAGPAAAQLELVVSGDVFTEIGFVSEDDDAGTDRDYGTRNDADVNFIASGVAENGLKYGARIIMEGAEGGDGDAGGEASINLQSGFGTIVVGEDDGASSNIKFGAPSAGTGILDGSFGGYVGGGSILDFDTADSGDANKIYYSTQGTALDDAGVTLGLSWAPEADERGDARGQASRVQDSTENVFAVGASYEGSFGSTSFGVSGGYVYGDQVTGDDHNAFQIGLKAGFGAFEVGAQYVDNDTAAAEDDHTLILGAGFSQGPWNFGAQLGFGEEDDQDEVSFGVGATYAIAPGLSAQADVVIFDNDVNDGFVGIARLAAVF
ncbi:MAG: porin [Pseudomonadota bacterium]